MTEPTKVASLNPEDFTEGGGLPAVNSVCTLNLTFEMFDYEGKRDPAPGIGVDMVDAVSGEDYGHQFYSAGNGNDFTVSDDGKYLVPLGEKKAPNKNSNAGVFLINLLNAGFPFDRLSTGDITKASGVVALMGEVLAPKFDGEVRKRKGKDGKEYDVKILVPVEIRDLPGSNPNKKKGTAAATKKTTAVKKPATTEAADDSGESAEDKAVAFIKEKLAAAGDEGLAKKGLAGEAMRALAQDPDRTAIVRLCGLDDFLSNHEDDWLYADGILIATPE